MFLKVCNFSCDRLLICVSLFEESCGFKAVYRIVLEGLSHIFLHRVVPSGQQKRIGLKFSKS